MSEPNQYPLQKLSGDYLRSAIGFTVCVLPFYFGTPLAAGAWLLIALAVMFAVFALRTVLRQMMKVWVSDDGVAVTGLVQRLVKWDRLSEVTLSYYSTWKLSGSGWMQIRLRGDGQTVRFESTLTGFEDIAQRAAEAARQNGLALKPATIKNFGAMGIEI